MSFFSQEALQTTGSFDSNSFEVIPDNTKALAVITNAEWREANEYNAKHVSLTWDIVEGEFKGRKVFQKIKLFESDKDKVIKAQKMLIAIDANCKGAIAQAGVEPTVQGLASLLHSPMYIMIKEYEMNGNKGNWVCAVSERKRGAKQAQKQPSAPVAGQEPPMDFDDDIPFAPIGLMYPSVAIHVI